MKRNFEKKRTLNPIENLMGIGTKTKITSRLTRFKEYWVKEPLPGSQKRFFFQNITSTRLVLYLVYVDRGAGHTFDQA